MLVVGPNLSLDETVTIPELHVGTIHRVSDVLRLAGGKGANVARALRVLGGEPLLIGFAGGASGALLIRLLDDDGIAHQLIPVAGDTRTCFTIADATSGAQTEVYGSGPAVSAAEVAALLAAVTQALSGQRWLVLSGSLPPGAPSDLYAQCVVRARQQGVRTVLDAKGAALRAGLLAGPDIVKINAGELGDAVGTDPPTPQAVAASAARMLERGVRAALITLGRDGAVLVAHDLRLHVRVPPCDVVSPVGSGDAATAGLVAALDHGADLVTASRAAVAAGTANALHLGAGRFTRQEYDALLAESEATDLE